MTQGENKYQFIISFDGGVEWYGLMLTKNPTISGSRDEFCADHRRSTDEWKLVRHENPAVYDRVLSMISDPASQTEPIMLKIELWDDWATKTSEEFVGYVPMSAFNVNEDTGVIRFTPADNSSYAWWDEHGPDKHDLINEIESEHTITYDSTSKTKEYWVEGDWGNNPVGYENTQDDPMTFPEWAVGVNYVHDNPDYLNFGKGQWVRYGHKNWQYPDGGMGVGDPPIYGWCYYYCKSDHLSAGNSEPGVGIDWKDRWHGPVRVVLHIASQESDMPMISNPLTVGGVVVSSEDYQWPKGNGLFVEGFPQEVPLGGGYWPGLNDETNHPSDRYYLATADEAFSPQTGNFTLTETGNIQFRSAVSHMLAGSGLTFESQFFSLDDNPVTGTRNHVSSLFLSFKQYILRRITDDKKGEITLADFITDLCELFNLMWYIDPVMNQFVMEHVMFFENGRQYVGSPEIYTDLTDADIYPLRRQVVTDLTGKKTDGEYSFKDQAPTKETYVLQETFDVESRIEYQSVFARKGSSIAHNVSSFTTDLKYTMDHADDADTNGYLLIATEGSGNLLRRNVTKAGTTEVTEEYPNGDLFFDNLLRDFHTHGRCFKKGKINADVSATTFDSVRRLKKQRQIIFPRVEEGAWDPLKLIHTNLGDGQVDSFEISTDTDWLKVDLIYPAE